MEINPNYYQIIESDGYITLKLNENLSTEVVKIIQTECLEKVSKEPYRDVIVNGENLSEITPNGIRFLMELYRKVKYVNKQLRLVSLTPSIARYITEQGVEESLKISPSVRAALVDFGLMTPKALDVNFINPFLTATIEVLRVQTSTESKAGAPYRRDSKEKFLGDISGIIGLISEAFTGSVVISFPEKTFLTIISRMLGENFTTLTPEIQDGAGELTNIIFGQAKVILNNKGYGIKTAIPSVVMGKDHHIQNISNGPRVTIPFTTDIGNFFIEICVSQ